MAWVSPSLLGPPPALQTPRQRLASAQPPTAQPLSAPLTPQPKRCLRPEGHAILGTNTGSFTAPTTAFFSAPF